MLISRLKPEECEQLLARLRTGRLACARDNKPYIVPIYFAYEPGFLYGFATLGRKIEWMRSNRFICVQVDEVVSRNEWTSVIVNGWYEEFPERPEFSEKRRHARSLLEKDHLWQAGYAAYQVRDQRQPTPILYGVHIEEMTGLRSSPDHAERAIMAGFG
jgi:nitroimidazol reductase NimA-like FMN-containing flavoprotein (pyridoxamine 5'-phosphate oxidase superfamily)